MNDETEPKCATCIFSCLSTCKCYASTEHYNKELPDETCEYYLEDDVDEIILDGGDLTEKS